MENHRLILPANWFGVARDWLGTSEFYWRSPFRHRYFRWSFITLVLICAFVATMVAKSWTRISVFVVAWLVIALVFAIRLFLVVLRSHQALHLLLTSGQLERPEKGSALEIVLGVSANVSNWALALAFSSIIACLFALFAVLIEHWAAFRPS
jgi:di/tricarboxylate transporter